MVQLQKLFKLSEESVDDIIKSISLQENDTFSSLDTFEGLPTSVVFSPLENLFSGSLHYMRFPSGKKQRYHYHPKSRYLFILGSCSMHFRYSTAGIEDNPLPKSQLNILKPYNLYALRFPANTWHQFSTAEEKEGCIIAFSFHEDDDGEVFRDGFMEELTFFYNG